VLPEYDCAGRDWFPEELLPDLYPLELLTERSEEEPPAEPENIWLYPEDLLVAVPEEGR